MSTHSRSRLALALAAACLTALALGSAAFAAKPSKPRSGATVHLEFRVHLPASATAQVHFTDGVEGIGTQLATSQTNDVGIRSFIAEGRGFVTGAGNAPLDVSVDELVSPKESAKALQGNAVLPPGATLTVRVVGAGAATPVSGPFTIALDALGKRGPGSSTFVRSGARSAGAALFHVESRGF